MADFAEPQASSMLGTCVSSWLCWLGLVLLHLSGVILGLAASGTLSSYVGRIQASVERLFSNLRDQGLELSEVTSTPNPANLLASHVTEDISSGSAAESRNDEPANASTGAGQVAVPESQQLHPPSASWYVTDDDLREFQDRVERDVPVPGASDWQLMMEKEIPGQLR